MKIIFSIGLSLILVACASGTDTEPDQQHNQPFDDETLLQFVGFGGSVLDPQKRFVGYARKSQRVSVIDPDQKTEVWGKQIPATYQAAFPLFDSSGVVLVSTEETELRILTDAQDLSFSFDGFQAGHFSRAAGAHAFAAWNRDGSQVKILRFQQGEWREQTLASSAAGISDFSEPPDSESPAMVGAFFSDGSRLVNFHPANGALFTYEVGESGDFQLALDCAPLTEGSVGAANFRALALDDARKTLYVGDVAGTVWALSLTTCSEGQSPRAPRTADLPITEMTLIETGKVAVTQAGGGFHIFTFDGANFDEEFSGQTGCEYPRGAVNVDDDMSLIVCYTPENFDAVNEAKNAPAVIAFRESFLQSYSRQSRTAIQRINIDMESTAGVAIDAEERQLVRLVDSTLGVLEIISLETGGRTLKKGIFLRDILELD